MARRIAAGIGLIGTACVAGLAAVLAIQVARTGSLQIPAEPASVPVDANAVAAVLAAAIRFPTVSRDGDPTERDALLGLHELLVDRFPLVHDTLEREEVNGLSLLYTWTGTDPDLEPTVLMGHLDVVPVEPASRDLWEHPPFSGVIADGFVWGRGAIDNKMNVVGILAAVEQLLAEGFRPRRTLLLAFGHDEEIGGLEGAARIAERIGTRHPRLHLVLDEGGVIVASGVPGIDRPVALIGIAEKGYLTVELAVEGRGGHSSMPPQHTAAGRLARAVTRLEEHPLPAALEGPSALMFRWLAPEMSQPFRTLMSNLWLTEGLLLRRFTAKPDLAATVRTTTAVTMLSGSQKENVLPTRATAHVNFRIRPGESTASVLAHISASIDDPEVAVTPLPGMESEPSPTSALDPIFGTLQRTVGEVFPGTLVAPFLVVGMTDARYYAGLSDHVYRFTAVTVGDDDLGRIHGTNERISVDDMGRITAYYVRLIHNTSG